MASKFYVPGSDRAPRVQDLFAAVAPHYDRINDWQSFGLHRYWKRRMLDLAAPQPGDRALDVCCGTGDVTFALTRRGALSVGFDFSPGMLDVARRRKLALPAEAAARVEFQAGDALALPFDAGAFDLVTISYGLRNLADFNRGLAELTRVLAPGGRLVVLDFGKPDNLVWRWVYFQYLRWICPLFGKLFCGDADTHGYILDSLKTYPAQRGVDARLRDLGYAETQLIHLFGGMMSLNLGKRPAAATPARLPFSTT